jgi:hypothetical protein
MSRSQDTAVAPLRWTPDKCLCLCVCVCVCVFAELAKEVPRDGLRGAGDRDRGRRSVDWSLPPMRLADDTLDSQVGRLRFKGPTRMYGPTRVYRPDSD